MDRASGFLGGYFFLRKRAGDGERKGWGGGGKESSLILVFFSLPLEGVPSCEEESSSHPLSFSLSLWLIKPISV